MKPAKIIIASILVFQSFLSHAQSDLGVLKPGQKLENSFTYNLFYMSQEKVQKVLDLQSGKHIDSLRIEKYKELIRLKDERIAKADSAISLKKMEADFWHQKLLINDDELLESKKENIRLRNSRLYYFIAGIVSTSVVVIAAQ